MAASVLVRVTVCVIAASLVGSAASESRAGWVDAFAGRKPGPAVGDRAPEFRLAALGGETLSLSAARADRPVALIFGSFT